MARIARDLWVMVHYLFVPAFEHNSKGPMADQIFPAELKLPHRLHCKSLDPVDDRGIRCCRRRNDNGWVKGRGANQEVRASWKRRAALLSTSLLLRIRLLGVTGMGCCSQLSGPPCCMLVGSSRKCSLDGRGDRSPRGRGGGRGPLSGTGSLVPW